MAKILLIDDSRYARLKLSEHLKEAGFEVIEAENGEEGLQKVKTENPDVIICDLLMPVMDGLGFLEELKIKQKITIPVLVITSDIQDRTRKRVMELGATDLINKPPKYPEVIKTLQELTRESK